MPSSIWKGHISFGLVSIPIVLHSAEKRQELRFHLLDSRDQSRIHYERINDTTGKEVPWDKIVKAFEYDKNSYVVLNPEDFKRAAPKATKTIDIKNFVNYSDINFMYFEKPYYLAPDRAGEKGYALLRETLKKTKKVAIAKIVIREREYLAAILPMENALVLNLLRFAQEILPTKEFNIPEGDLKDYHILPNELKMAEALVASMTAKWQPKLYHDDYRDALMKWIEQKTLHHGKTKKAKVTAEEKTPAKTLDFMAALKKSLANAKRTPSKSHAKQHHKPSRHK